MLALIQQHRAHCGGHRQRHRLPRTRRLLRRADRKRPEGSGVAYVIVNEAGASVYSTSRTGREEFPAVGRRPAAAHFDRPAAARPLERMVKSTRPASAWGSTSTT